MPKNTAQKTETKTDTKTVKEVVNVEQVKAEPVQTQKGKGKKTAEVPAPVVVAPPQPEPVKETKAKKPAKETKPTEAKAPEPEPVKETKTTKTKAKKEETAPVEPAKETKAPKATKPKAKKETATTDVKVEKKAKQPKEKAQSTEQSGGESEDQGDMKRHFRLLKDDGTTEGRFAGRKPKQAANKVLTSLVNQFQKAGGDPVGKEFRFKIVECTRNSRRVNGKCLEYEYAGTRVKLDKPNQVKIKKDGAPVKTIEYKHVNRLHKVKKQPEVAVATA